jgi:hypothetical protein
MLSSYGGQPCALTVYQSPDDEAELSFYRDAGDDGWQLLEVPGRAATCRAPSSGAGDRMVTIVLATVAGRVRRRPP